MYTGPDKYIYPFWISGDHRITFDGETETFTFQLAPGWYRLTYSDEPDLSLNVSISSIAGVDYEVSVVDNTDDGRRPFLNALIDGVNQMISLEGGSTELGVSAETPTEEGEDNTGLRIEQTAGSLDLYTLDFAEDFDDWPENDLLLRIVGLSPGEGRATSGDFQQGSGEVSDYSCWGWWHSVVTASDKRGEQRRASFTSQNAGGEYYTNTWNPADHRRFHYFDVPAEAVRIAPALLNAGTRYQENNAVTHLLRQASSAPLFTYVIHGDGFDSTSLNVVDYDNVEEVLFNNPATFTSFRDVIEDLSGGERYELRWEVEVASSTWRH